MDLRGSRLALLAAVNAHDIEAIRSFVDSSYVARGPGGLRVMGYDQLMDYAAKMFAKHPEYRESLEIEAQEVDGPTGRLTTRRTESSKGLLGAQRTNVARQVETWKQVDGRWVLVEERAEPGPATAGFTGLPGGGAARPRWSVGLLIACAAVVVASFLPWGSVPAAVNFGDMKLPFGDFAPFGPLTLTVTGWNGHLNVGGLTMPNWVVVVGAVVIAAFHGLAAAGVWTAHPLVNLLIAGYGILHVVALGLILLANKGGINVGLIATMAAYITILVVLARELRAGTKGVQAEL